MNKVDYYIKNCIFEQMTDNTPYPYREGWTSNRDYPCRVRLELGEISARPHSRTADDRHDAIRQDAQLLPGFICRRGVEPRDTLIPARPPGGRDAHCSPVEGNLPTTDLVSRQRLSYSAPPSVKLHPHREPKDDDRTRCHCAEKKNLFFRWVLPVKSFQLVRSFPSCCNFSTHTFLPIVTLECVFHWNLVYIMLEVDETFTTIWLSTSKVRVKVRRWPQSPVGTIFS